MDETQRIIDGAARLGVVLDAVQAATLSRLLDELTRWNRTYNLTAVTARHEMITHHLLDSLSVTPHLHGVRIADVGTGAGFPGLPLALAQPPSDARQRAEHLLSQVGLKDRMAWKPAQLSGGERQRVAVVRALINQPRLILADEPTGALDEKNAEALTTLLLDLQKTTSTTLVMVTHHPAQAARMSRVLKIHEGRLA